MGSGHWVLGISRDSQYHIWASRDLSSQVTVYTNDKEDDKAMAALQKIAELSK